MRESRRRIARAGVRTSPRQSRAAGRPARRPFGGLRGGRRARSSAFCSPICIATRMSRGCASEADAIVRRLFAAYSGEPAAMPREWASAAGRAQGDRARSAADYIAGMTDRFAIAEHRRFLTRRPSCVRARAATFEQADFMNIFADFQPRVAALLADAIEAGRLPATLDLGRFVVEPPRDPRMATSRPTRRWSTRREAKAGRLEPARAGRRDSPRVLPNTPTSTKPRSRVRASSISV